MIMLQTLRKPSYAIMASGMIIDRGLSLEDATDAFKRFSACVLDLQLVTERINLYAEGVVSLGTDITSGRDTA